MMKGEKGIKSSKIGSYRLLFVQYKRHHQFHFTHLFPRNLNKG